MQLPLVWIACISTVGKIREDIRHLLEFGPVELDVLPRRHVAVAAIVAARDVRKHAQLPRRQQSVGNRDAQHRRMALQVQAVAQAQVLEFVVRELPGEKSARLVAKLRDALVDERLVDGIVAIHMGATLGQRAPELQ